MYYSVDNSGQHDVKIVMHSKWSHEPPGGMGREGRSRTLTPVHYDETRENPERSWLLLRAWMLWRVRANDRVSGDRGWQGHVADEALSLERKIQITIEGGYLLGSSNADALLKMWVPDIAGRLCGT